MNTLWLFTTAAALLAAPLGLAHTPEGSPKLHCEGPWDFYVHDYGDPPLADILLTSVPRSHGGSAKVIEQYADGSDAGCTGGGEFNYDGHHEWSPTTWALLVVDSGDGVTTGGWACWHEVGHHPAFGPIHVWDIVNGYGQAFWVTSDTRYTVPPTDSTANCGDFESDNGAPCAASPCTVTFPPGLDGAYEVFAGDPVTFSAASFGHTHSP